MDLVTDARSERTDCSQLHACSITRCDSVRACVQDKECQLKTNLEPLIFMLRRRLAHDSLVLGGDIESLKVHVEYWK